MSPIEQVAFINLFEGIIIGYLLQRSGLCDFGLIKNQFSFKNNVVVKIFLSAIATGALGLLILTTGFGYKTEPVMPTLLLAGSIGGLIIGLAMALCGSEQLLAFVRIGSGRLGAGAVIAGMIASSIAFKKYYPLLPNEIFSMNLGNITLANIFNIPEIYGIVTILIITITILFLIRKSS